MLTLPDNCRDALKEPIGIFVKNDKELLKAIEKEKYIVSIGDQVTYTLIKHDIEPVFCIVDYKTGRGDIPKEHKELIKSFAKKTIGVENPATAISDDLWTVIKISYENLEKGSVKIEVIGEEDLAALAAIFLAPPDVTIIYGLPNRGVVIVKSTEEHKKKVKEIIDKM